MEFPSPSLALKAYLRARLKLPDLDYAVPPELFPDGLEVYTFKLQLAGRGLPADLRGPLVLRLYAGENGLPALRHEWVVQHHLHGRGFRVARPLIVEENVNHLGGPFMLRECLPGKTMLDSMFRHPWRIFLAPFQMGMLHARLHSLPVENFPSHDGSFLDRWLDTIERRITDFELHGLDSGMRWLLDHRPADPGRPSILHMDFHPINLLYHRGISGVLDWPEADVGDPHADLATTLVLMETTSVHAPGRLGRLLSWPGRILLRRFYLRGYGLKRSIDWSRLPYYVALSALRRLSRWGMWLRESPGVTGCKPGALQLLADGGVCRLEQCFARKTGVDVRLLSGEPAAVLGQTR